MAPVGGLGESAVNDSALNLAGAIFSASAPVPRQSPGSPPHGLCQVRLGPTPSQPPHPKPLPPHPQLASNFPRIAILILWRKNAVGRNLQLAISGRKPRPLRPESGDSEFERAPCLGETSRGAITLVFPTLTHDALCFQPLATHRFRKPRRINTCKKQQKKLRSENCLACRRQKPRKKSPQPLCLQDIAT